MDSRAMGQRDRVRMRELIAREAAGDVLDVIVDAEYFVNDDHRR